MATLTAAQIKAIGDAATKKAGGDPRAGAAAVAQAQSKAAKATSADSVYNYTMKNIQSGSGSSSSGSSNKSSSGSSNKSGSGSSNKSSSGSSNKSGSKNQSRYNPATASASKPNYTLTAAQIQRIGDNATRAAGGDPRAGAAAVAWAQNQAAKAKSYEEVVLIYSTASGYDDAKDFDQTIYQMRYGTPVRRENPTNPWEQVNLARAQMTEDTYANQYYYQNNLPKTSDYEYHSRYLPSSTVVKTQPLQVGAGLGGYIIPKNINSPTPTPEQSRYNPLAPVPSTPATPEQHDANIKDTSAAATTAGSGGSGNTGGSSSYVEWLESLDWNNYNSGGGSYGGGSGGGSYGGGSGGSSYGGANTKQLILGLPVEAQRAVLSDIQSLADLYGIDYNRDSIESVFKDATNAAHEANLKEYDRTARQYYDKLGATQNSLIDALRKQRAASITSGANAGMQNATELSEILGLTQTVSPDALALAQDRNALIEAYNAQLAQNVRDAMEYSDQLKQALAALASEKYGYDAQQYVAELSHNANVQAQNTASSAAYTGKNYTTLEDILGLAVVPSLTYTKKE